MYIALCLASVNRFICLVIERFVLKIHQNTTNYFFYSVDISVSIRVLHLMKVSDRDRNVNKVRKIVLIEVLMWIVFSCFRSLTPLSRTCSECGRSLQSATVMHVGSFLADSGDGWQSVFCYYLLHIVSKNVRCLIFCNLKKSKPIPVFIFIGRQYPDIPSF